MMTTPRASNYHINHNFLSRITYGNREKKTGISICQWNAGSGLLRNSMEEVLQVIEDEQPLVLGITEALVRPDCDMSELSVEGYHTYVADTINNPDLM